MKDGRVFLFYWPESIGASPIYTIHKDLSLERRMAPNLMLLENLLSMNLLPFASSAVDSATLYLDSFPAAEYPIFA